MSRSLIFIATLVLSSCTVIPQQEPVNFYQLPPPLQENATAGPRLSSLRIYRPVTSEVLAGNRLLIMATENQLQAFPGARLATPVPLLWRDWLLDAFGQDGRIDGLSAASEGLRAELELGGTLRAFQVEFSDTRPQAVIQYDAMLIDPAGRNILASRRFEARQPMASVEAAAAIDALGAAANQLAGELINWTLEQGPKKKPGY